MQFNSAKATDERLLMHYGAGVFDFKEHGTLLTDRAVSTYYQDEDTLEIDAYSMPLKEITHAEFGESNTLTGEILLWVYARDDEEMGVYLSTVDNSHQVFMQALKARI